MDEIIEEILDAVHDICQAFQEMVNKICSDFDRFFERIEMKNAERPKWRRFNVLKPRPLLLDKRSKIHRCRNNC